MEYHNGPMPTHQATPSLSTIRLLSTAIAITALTGAGTLNSALLRDELARSKRHITARCISLGSAAIGFVGSEDLLKQSTDNFNTPYTTAIYRAYFSAGPSTPLETFCTFMNYLPWSAQYTVVTAACGLVTGVATLGYGSASYMYHGISFLRGGQQVDKDGMTRGALTAGCGLLASSVSALALVNILDGIGKTLDTHESALETLRKIRTRSGI